MFKHIDGGKRIALKRESIDGRRWYYLPNGQPVLSVTTVLGHEEKPGLVAWQQSLGIDKAAKETQRCADRGTAVHKMAENYLNNDPDPTDGFHPDHIKVFNQLKLKINGINNIHGLELPLHSTELEIAGTADCIGEYNNKLSVIDFKTSNNNKDDKLIHDYKLQCCAYALCFYEMYGTFIEDYVILIGVEKGMVPQVYKGKVIEYADELNKRIKEVYDDIL